MMKTKNLKIWTLALAIVILVTSALCISAFAEQTPESPVIASKNLSYEDNTHLYYAVAITDNVTAQNTTLNIYSDAACTTALATGLVGNVETLAALGGGEYIVFRAPGIAAKHITRNVYAQAVTTAGGASQVVKYSVAEYLLERLYVSENLGKTVTAEQKELYKSYLQYGANAQTLFTNSKVENEEDKETLATALNIARVIDGTFADGTNQKLFEGTGATVVATPSNSAITQWQVITTAADGTVSRTKTANTTDNITINGQTVITAPQVAPPLTFDSADDLRYFSLATAYGDGSIESTVEKGQKAVALKVADGQMVLESPVYHNNIITFNRTGDGTGTKAVFEADVIIDVGDVNSSTSTGGALWINFIFFDQATGEALTPVRVLLGDGDTSANTNAQGTNGVTSTSVIKDNVKFSNRLEYMINAYGYNTTLIYVKEEGATEWDASLYRSTETAKAPASWDNATQTGTPTAPWADDIGFKIEVNRFEECTLTLDNVRFDGE